jgi:hypothetical protein
MGGLRRAVPGAARIVLVRGQDGRRPPRHRGRPAEHRKDGGKGGDGPSHSRRPRPDQAPTPRHSRHNSQLRSCRARCPTREILYHTDRPLAEPHDECIYGRVSYMPVRSAVRDHDWCVASRSASDLLGTNDPQHARRSPQSSQDGEPAIIRAYIGDTDASVKQPEMRPEPRSRQRPRRRVVRKPCRDRRGSPGYRPRRRPRRRTYRGLRGSGGRSAIVGGPDRGG